MATRLAWLLNFDADLRLASNARRKALASEDLQRFLARLTDLVAEEDLILNLPDSAKSDRDLTVLTFCPTPDALAQITALGLTPPAAPSLSVLRRVNDRAFCAELGHGLPNSCFARDMSELVRTLALPSPTGSYVIKRAFSFAGREQRRVRDGVLDDSTRGFCARSFARGEGVQIEPWVARTADFSAHGYLSRAGELLCGQPRQQHCDAMGRFERVSAGTAELRVDERKALASSLSTTGNALKNAGYFGPFGIDAFRYGDREGEHFNARCEINARFTMGYPRELLLRGLTADACLT